MGPQPLTDGYSRIKGPIPLISFEKHRFEAIRRNTLGFQNSPDVISSGLTRFAFVGTINSPDRKNGFVPAPGVFGGSLIEFVGRKPTVNNENPGGNSFCYGEKV